MPYRLSIHHLLTLAAFLGLFIALTLPNRLEWITPPAFVFFPLEFMVIGLLLLLPGRLGSASRVLMAVFLSLAMVLRGADLVTHEIFGRPFDLIFDSHLLADGSRLLTGVVGSPAALFIALLLALLAIFLCYLALVMLRRIQLALHSAPRVSASIMLGLLLAWSVMTAAGWPRAKHFAWDQLVAHSRDTVESVSDIRRFARTVNVDALGGVPDGLLLNRLGNKDVFLVFAESYGRVLLERQPFREPVRATLASAEKLLTSSGVQVRSAFMTSPTVGGLSWLAHASVLSGAWIDSETRYKTLMLSERVTLNRLFQEAGWRTVAAMPAISMPWPEGQYYGYDHIYNAHNFGYAGLPFNWVTMPDQYVLSALQARERSAAVRPPVMAEIALISSHAPWTPIAELVPWDRVGNGRVFDRQALSGLAPETVWRDTEQIRYHYRRSIEYMLQTMVSYVLEYGDENLVIVLMGDHPPAPMVSGDTESSQVPVHLITRDPDVIDAIAQWHWHAGLLPGADAPVWRMDEFRNRFVAAFSERPAAGE